MKELDICKSYYLGNLTEDQRKELFIKNFQDSKDWKLVAIGEFALVEDDYLEFDVYLQEWDWRNSLETGCVEVDARELFEEEEKVAPNLVPLFDAVEIMKELKEGTELIVEKAGVKDNLMEKIKELKALAKEHGLDVEVKIK